MLEHNETFKGQTAEYQNLRRLFMLRNFAIIGQLIAVYITQIYLDIPLPVLSIGMVIFAFALFNLFTLFRLRWGSEVTQLEFLLQLLVDVLILTALLYLTGGASNPFVLLFLLPVIIATAVLSTRYIWVLTLITVACYSLLMWKYQPLPHSHGSDSGFSLHVFGMWLSFIVSATVTSYLVSGMRRSLREKDIELSRAREQQVRDEQLVLLGTLSASTAHEMGTPLGTMSLLCEELSYTVSNEQKKLITTLSSQIERCKDALSNLSTATGGVALSGGKLLSIDLFLEQLLNEWQSLHPGVTLVTKWHGTSSNAFILADRTLQQAILNVLDNAYDASPDDIEWLANWGAKNLTIIIKNKGDGLTGEAEKSLGSQPFSAKESGLGLGLFLTHSIIQRFGGEVRLKNRKNGGVSTTIHIPVINQEA